MRALTNIFSLHRGEEPIMYTKVQIFVFFEKICFQDAVDCPEWIVPCHVFKALGEEYELGLVFVKNSHEFVHEYLKRPEYVELMRRLGALGDGNQDQKRPTRQIPGKWRKRRREDASRKIRYLAH